MKIAPQSKVIDLATRTKSRVAARVRPWLGCGLDLMFPPSCLMCFAAIESSVRGLVCEGCRNELVARTPACARCGCQAALNSTDGCVRCQHEKLHFTGVVRLGGYEGALRTAVLRMKNQRERALAKAIGDLLTETRSEQLASMAPDAIVPIPMHWSRRVWRGTNSPQTIAEQLSRHLRVPLAGHLLQRRRRTAPQARLSSRRRAQNVRGAFRARSHADLPGARLLVIDDIMTTGATVNEAAKTLLAAGASAVSVAVVARADGLG